MIQLQYLNKILQTKDSSLMTFNGISPEFFPEYKKEFWYIQQHLKEFGNIPDRETFLGKFPDFDVFDVSESNQYLIDALYKDYNKVALAKTFNAIRDAMINNDIDGALKTYTDSIDSIKAFKPIESVDILSDTSRYDEYVDKTTDFTKYYVGTGFKELDEVIGGWDIHEDLVTIIARPGVGKSWCLLKIAVAAAKQGMNVGIYSGEMSDKLVGYRVDTLISHISNTKLVRGNSEIQVEYKKYMDSLVSGSIGHIKVLTPQMIHGVAGVSALQSFIERENLQMLCIDQHSLLDDDRGAKNPVERASNISRDLKQLQVMKKIPIIAVSQQNRESTDNGITVANVAQADRIGQDSTVVLALEHADDILTVNLIKSRNSVSGKKLRYQVDLDKGFFNYIPIEKDATNGSHCEELKEEFDETEDTF